MLEKKVIALKIQNMLADNSKINKKRKHNVMQEYIIYRVVFLQYLLKKLDHFSIYDLDVLSFCNHWSLYKATDLYLNLRSRKILCIFSINC